MKIVEVKVFKFEELSDAAKAVAIENQRKREYGNSNFVDEFTPRCVEKAEESGFEEPSFQYSLSNSQGDGLSFKAKRYGKLVDVFKEVLGAGKEKTAQLLADNMTQVFSGNDGHYAYAKKNQVDMYLENYTSSINVKNTNRIDEVVAKVLAKVEDIYMDLCNELEKEGYADLDYRFSDEYQKETIEANEYEFTEDGERF